MTELSDAAARSLEQWHAMVEARDLKTLPSLVHPDAVFRSPVAHKPYHGAMALCLALTTVLEVFEDFTYHRAFASEDGVSVALEFSARVNGRDLKGADFIRFDSAGLITEFEVMIRPLSGLTALAEEMGKRLEGKLQGFA